MDCFRLTWTGALAAAATSIAFVTAPAMASTQVGEMIVLESSGPNEPDPEAKPQKKFSRTLKTRMLFREYFSSPSLATPNDEFTSTGSGGAWLPNRTMFLVDGRPVRTHVGARMLKPGTVIYYFINRRVPHFISIHTHERPISGRLVSHEQNTLVLRRLIGLKFESSGVVYQDQPVRLKDDTRYVLDGKEATANSCLTEDRFIRVLAAQPLTISAFTDDALLDTAAYYSEHVGTRAGFLKATGDDVHTLATPGENGWIEEKRTGGTGLLDGQFMFDKLPVTQPGNQVVAFCYRKNMEKCIFLIGRSKAMGLVDGELIKVAEDSVTVRVYPDQSDRTWPLNASTRFRVNGQDASGVDALKPGMNVTLFEPRPQVVDAWTLPPVAVPEDQQVIVYDVEGRKTVVKEGRLPKRIEANLLKEKK